MTTRYQSHPDRLLRDHLLEVAEGAKASLDHPALAHRELLREVAWLVGFCHDVGKYTSYFQDHLRGDRGSSKEGLERHAFVGAVFAAWVVFQRLPALPEAPNKEFLPLLAYLAVHRHHGNLRSPEQLVPKSRELRRWPHLGNVTGEHRRALKAFQRQLDDLRTERQKFLQELDAIPEAGQFFSSASVPREVFRQLDELRYRLQKKPGEDGALSEEQGARLCLWGQLLFSALINADKFSAAGLSRDSHPSLPADLVQRFLQARYPQPRHDVDRHRAAFHQMVRRRVETLKPEEIPGQIFSLTAPTGMGKTLASLDCALILRQKLQTLWGVPPRIIYALPFVNIIEQNYDVFNEVFRQLGDAYDKEPERFLLRHHHLAEVTYRKEDQNLPVEKALLMTETWESEVIVTTFVQLFQTLLGHTNRFLKKMHNLIGAVVILDELQALPMEYWPLTANLFQTLGRELGLVVLQMTATRPLIFPKARQLHPNPNALFTAQKRTRMHIESVERPQEAWTERVVEIFEAHGSVLAVVNTVSKSLEIYRLLRDQAQGHPFASKPPRSDPWLLYLSTNITPKQRRQRLEALREHLQKGGRALVVSTQVVEAGVDIDFPAVVRDLGPLDSIVQVAGRCNREGRLKRGHVYVLPLRDGGCAQIYGAVHAHMTRDVLKGREELDEPEYAWLVEQYFRETQKRLSQQASTDLWMAYGHLDYDHFEKPALSDFHLIESRDQVPIFVALTPEDERWLMEEFKAQVLGEQDIARRRAAYLKHRKRLHDSMIRPLLSRAAQNLPPAVTDSEGLRWIPHDQLQDYYDPETGFRWQESQLATAWVA